MEIFQKFKSPDSRPIKSHLSGPGRGSRTLKVVPNVQSSWGTMALTVELETVEAVLLFLLEHCISWAAHKWNVKFCKWITIAYQYHQKKKKWFFNAIANFLGYLVSMNIMIDWVRLYDGWQIKEVSNEPSSVQKNGQKHQYL